MGIISRDMKEGVVGGIKYFQEARHYHHLSSLDLPLESDSRVQMCPRHLKPSCAKQRVIFPKPAPHVVSSISVDGPLSF